MKYGKTGFILEKRKKSNKFNRLQIEGLSLQNIPPPSFPEYRPLKFVLCPYIHSRCINGILRYNHQNHLKSLHPLHIINSKFPLLRENQEKHFVGHAYQILVIEVVGGLTLMKKLTNA